MGVVCCWGTAVNGGGWGVARAPWPPGCPHPTPLPPSGLCSKSPYIMRLLEQQGILFLKSIEIVVADRTKRRPSSCRTGRNNCEWLSYEIGSQWLSLSQNELDLAEGQDRLRHMELRARGHSPTV